MSDHLSSTQFAKAFVDGPAGLEQQHLAECSECRAELDRLAGVVSSFRSALRERVDKQVDVSAAAVSAQSSRPAAQAAKLRWVLAVAAVVALVLVPFFTREKESREAVKETSVQTDPDALMDAVSIHLLRTVPAPMEPMLGLVPSAESKTESGGHR
jgi:predicted anti-sigma-YlaC factor YlaD